jgi:hypothetical protein
MQRFLFVAAVAAITVPALAANAGVSIQIGQPGFYGSIDIGGFPAATDLPAANRDPAVPGRVREPIYLHAAGLREELEQALPASTTLRPTGLLCDSWYNQGTCHATVDDGKGS